MQMRLRLVVGLGLLIALASLPAACLGSLTFPALLFLAFWYAFGACAFWLVGMETKGRSIEEIDGAFAKPAVAAPRVA